MAVVDIFLKLDGIKGDSTVIGHQDEIELQAYSWGETNTGSHVASGAGAGAGRVSMQDFHFTARVSKASPTLMQACASGKHIKDGQVTLRKAGEKPVEFLFYKFDTVVITSVQDAGAAGDLPVEQVSFAFAKIQVEFKEQKADGSLGSSINFAWNLQANRQT